MSRSDDTADESGPSDLSSPQARRSSYEFVIGVYVAGVATTAWLARRRGVRLPERLDLRDLGLAAVATQRVATLLSRDPVTSPLRAPFTEVEGVQGPAELKERARDDSKLRHTLGELLTCPFCVGQWVGTAFVGGLVVAPRPARVAISAFAVIGAADWLQRLRGKLGV